MDCEEKLESSIAHASLDVAAKRTMTATKGVKEDWMAPKIALSWVTHWRCPGLITETGAPAAEVVCTMAGGHSSVPSTNPPR